MPLETRVFVLPKDPEHPEQFQDAFGLDAANGIAVVADGVSSALFSQQWADVITKAVVADPPNPLAKDYFAPWLAARRKEWSEQIDTTGLAWFQKAKLPNGAFSTLVFIRLVPIEGGRQAGAYQLLCYAIGDSCLFHVRGGKTVRTFPIEKSEQLEDNPVVLGSVDLSRDEFMEFHELNDYCYVDDVMVLCTDAIVDWALRRTEDGNPPNWNDYWSITQKQWEEEIAELRESRAMRYDDSTLVLLRVLPEGTEVRASDDAPHAFLPVSAKAPAPQTPPQPVAEKEPDIYPVRAEPPVRKQPVIPVAQPVVQPQSQSHPQPQPQPHPHPQPQPQPHLQPQPQAGPARLDEGERKRKEEQKQKRPETPPDTGADEWKEKFKVAGEQLAEGIEIASGEAVKNLKKWGGDLWKKIKKK